MTAVQAKDTKNVSQIHAAFCPPTIDSLETILTEELVFTSDKAEQYKVLCNPEVAVELFGYPDKDNFKGIAVVLVTALHPSLMVVIRESP